MRRDLLHRLANRCSRELMNRFGLSSRLTGYRHLRACSPAEFEYVEVHPQQESLAPLPLNVAEREELSRSRHITGFSFYDVPHRTIEPTFLAIVPNCRVLITENEWRDRHYAIVTADDRLLDLRGTGYRVRDHAPLMHARNGAVSIQRGTWILEAWDRNYAHWLQWHLTKINLLQKLDFRAPILVPPPAGMVSHTLDALAVDDRWEVTPGVLHVERLAVVGMDSYRPELLRDLRDRFAGKSPRKGVRKIFISRQDVTRRRLLNERECLEVLLAHGFESVIFERLTFLEQIATMQEAQVVVGLHGAGLANILFAAEGTHVLEIADETFPNPQYYALSTVLGHRYWLLHAKPGGDLRPGYHDLIVDVQQLEKTLTQLDERLV